MTLERIQLLHNYLTRLSNEPVFSTAAKMDMLRAKSVLEKAMVEPQDEIAAMQQEYDKALAEARWVYHATREQLAAQFNDARVALRTKDIAVDMPTINDAHFNEVNLTPDHLALLQPLVEFIQPANP